MKFKKTIISFLCFLFTSYTFSAKKIDVMDSLLQNVIDYFYEKLPKFIDKYGKDRFVADEPLTRGSILLLLYEYEQSLKKDTSIGDISSLQKKLDILEKKVLSLEKQQPSAQPISQPTQQTKFDIFEIMKELSPNMPVMLDTTLEKSEVFSSLKKEVEALKSTKPTLITQPATTKESPQDITLKLEQIEKDYSVVKKDIDVLKPLTQKLSLVEENYKQLSSELKNFRNSQQQDISNLKKELNDTLKSETSKSDKQMQQILSKLDNIEKKYSDIFAKTEKNLSQQKDELSKLQKEIIEVKTQLLTKSVSTEGKVDQKVFSDLVKKIDSFEENYAILSDNIKIIQQQNKELEDLKKEISYLKQTQLPQTIQQTTPSYSQKDIQNLTDKINNLEKKLAEFSKNQSEIFSSITKRYEFVPQRTYEQTEIKGYASILTKISLGLSIFSLLFIAR